MSKRVPGTQQTVLTVSDEIIQRSLGPDSNKIITDISSTHSDIDTHYQGKLNWKDIGSFLENFKPIVKTPDQNHLAPRIEKLNKNLLTAPLNYRICNNCKRPVLDTHLASHIDICQEIMRTKQAAKDKLLLSAQNGNKKGATTKKRKNAAAAAAAAAALSTDLDDSAKESTPGTPAPKRQKRQPKERKSKKEKARATPKPKEPVDVEKQCGVALPGGGFCARSLTCKTHSMGAKRAVPGRSAPYDQLLAQYQRKNQAKMAAGAALAQLAQDELMHGQLGPLDEDEETQLVIEGVSRSYALPLERKVIMPTRLRSSFLRMREMFASALLPRLLENSPSSSSGMEGRTLVVDIDKPNEYFHVVRPPQRVAMNQLQQHYLQQQLQQLQQQLQLQQLQLYVQLRTATSGNAAVNTSAATGPVSQEQLLLQQRLLQQRRQQLMQQQRLQQVLQLRLLQQQQQQ